MLHHSYSVNTMCCKTSFLKGTNKIAAFPEGFGPKIIEGILSRGQHIQLYMLIYSNKRKVLHKKRVQVQFPQGCLGTPTWPPFLCFGTLIWPPWHHEKRLYIWIRFLRIYVCRCHRGRRVGYVLMLDYVWNVPMLMISLWQNWTTEKRSV